MKKRIVNTKGFNSLFAAAIVMILFSASFIISFLRAESFYKKSRTQGKPYLKLDKINYYSKVLSYTDKAIKLHKNNAEYYAAKADCLLRAVDDKLEKELSIKRIEIEDLIKNAMRLNPTNFKYYLKLGWFYKDEEKNLAQYYLSKAVCLNPMEPQTRLFLARYYIGRKDFKSAFHNIMLSFHYGGYFLRGQLDKIKEELKENTPLSFEKRRGRIKYTVIVEDAEFDFKKEGFLHINPALHAAAYADKPSGEIFLYKDDTICGKFKPRKTGEDNVNIYNFALHNLPPDVYFDELKIKAAPPLIIEKIIFSRTLR